MVNEVLAKSGNGMSLREAIDKIYLKVAKEGLAAISPYTRHPGNLVLPRKYELGAAVNRYRELKVK